MKEILENKKAWNMLAKDHYETFKKKLGDPYQTLSEIILSELGNIKNQNIIHLQCNTGYDTILLARQGAKKVVGVDFSDQNILYANQLKNDFKVKEVEFIESDVLDLPKIHHDTYDMVFTSEGVLGWIPDIKQWAKVVYGLLKAGGYLYIHDAHPVFMTLDEEKLAESRVLEVKYPYFSNTYDVSDTIGGYASEQKQATNYFWSHKFSDIITALADAGLRIEYLHEYDLLCWDNGNMKEVKKGLFRYEDFAGKLPFSYSLRARK
ncbi:class I SAM-dependent methyltransferase [Peloplasma aerotolerans]|uniref:Class I SAM-dependent methyltransferase n=1 Tax=Peloplasma aerotolerans TaxID=3044389 RepID=A0AAW6U9M3_9MOLU|nr:class I SAM-dependent methyltransferase [Mariniplasma sp. M4Ah]MDI6452786.1 class I SAM-dependent methyltransferase [Mariniplasma sp. M4Ah]